MTIEEALKQLGELKFALSGTDEQFLDIVALDMAIRSLEAWQKVREEIGKEVECTDVSLKYREYQLGVDYGLGFALGVIDKALGEVGETDGNSV